MRKHVCLALCVVVIVAFSLLGAGQKEKAEEGVLVGVSLLTREHVFYNKIEEALVAEADALGFEVMIKDANRDSNLQMSQVQDFITQGVNAIILSPTSTAGIGPAIDLARKNGIPVFTMDIAAEEETISHVGTDNREGGRLAGEYTAEKILYGKGKAAIITYSEVESCVNREEGFMEVIAEYPDIEVVDIENCSGSAEKAANLAQDILVKYPDLDVIFGVGDPFAMGAYSSIKAANKSVKIIGFDGNPEAIAEIKKGGLWIADIGQDPEAIGKSAINLVKDYLEGKDVPRIKLIPPKVIDQESL